MDDHSTTGRRKTLWAGAASLLAAGAIGGGVLAGTLSASAADNTPAGTSQSATSPAPSDSSRGPGHGGAQPVRGDEKAVSTADDATLRAAALKAVPGGTVYRIETDAGDGTYEAHMTKADGTLVTVKFDQSLAVTQVEDGMGTGDPAGPGQPGSTAGPGQPGTTG
jgi:hypothetical protein